MAAILIRYLDLIRGATDRARRLALERDTCRRRETNERRTKQPNSHRVMIPFGAVPSQRQSFDCREDVESPWAAMKMRNGCVGVQMFARPNMRTSRQTDEDLRPMLGRACGKLQLVEGREQAITRLRVLLMRRANVAGAASATARHCPATVHPRHRIRPSCPIRSTSRVVLTSPRSEVPTHEPMRNIGATRT